jgi:hypothetical protein
MTRFKSYDPSMGITQDQYSQQIAQANEQLYGLSSLSGGQFSDQGLNRPRIPSFDDRGGYVDWRRDEPWINKETGEPWKSKGRGDMPPGSRAGPTDAPEPWPDDPRLAEYEKGPKHQVGGFPVTNGASLPPPGWPRPKVMPTPNPPVMEPPPPIASPPPPDIKPLLPPELLPDKTPEYSGQPRPTLINPILPGPLQLPTGQQSSGLTYSRGAAVKPPSLRLKHGGSLTSRVSHLLRILS